MAYPNQDDHIHLNDPFYLCDISTLTHQANFFDLLLVLMLKFVLAEDQTISQLHGLGSQTTMSHDQSVDILLLHPLQRGKASIHFRIQD